MLVRGSFHSRDEGSGDKVVTRCHPTMWMGFVPLSCTLKTGQTVKGCVLPTLKRTPAPPRTYTRELHASVRGRSREGRSCSSGPQAHTHAWSGTHGGCTAPARSLVHGGVLLLRGVHLPPLGLAELQLQGLAVGLQPPHPGLQRPQLLRVGVLHGGQRRVFFSGQTVELLVPARRCGCSSSRGPPDDT